MGQLDGDAAPERVAHDDRGLVEVDDPEELVEPGGVAGQREVVAGQVGGAPEARQGRCPDVATELGQALERSPVGVLAEPPPVEEHDGQALAGLPVERQPPWTVVRFQTSR